MSHLQNSVSEAVAWAADSGDRRAAALAALAVTLADELVDPNVDEHKAPPTAQLAKELRATLADLEALRDGDDAEASLGVVLSSPVWDDARSKPADAGSARRKGGRKSG